jgi:hypothetical protein
MHKRFYFLELTEFVHVEGSIEVLFLTDSNPAGISLDISLKFFLPP